MKIVATDEALATALYTDVLHYRRPCRVPIKNSSQRHTTAAIDTALLNNVKKVGGLVLSRTSCSDRLPILPQAHTAPNTE
jgi:hypothetical protein